MPLARPGSGQGHSSSLPVQPPSPLAGLLQREGMAEPVSDTDTEGEARRVPPPRWFTPLRLLIIFCFANIMVYMDRGRFSCAWEAAG